MKEWGKNNKEKVNANKMRRIASKLMATPKWANHQAIGCYYEFATIKTRITGKQWEVDHIVPLQSKYVCGLHTDYNLEVITKHKNISKLNRSWPDMW